jgi:hypothetical protein
MQYPLLAWGITALLFILQPVVATILEGITSKLRN